MSWAPEVKVDGKWSGNAIRFATKDEAEAYGRDLLMHWFVPSDSRAVESTDPVNYRRTPSGGIENVEGKLIYQRPTDTEIDAEGMSLREGRTGAILDDELDLN